MKIVSKKAGKKKKQTSLNRLLLLQGKMSIYSVDLNFIKQQSVINVDEMISLLEKKSCDINRK